MQVQSMHFKARAGAKLADVTLQANLKSFKGKFVGGRAKVVAEYDREGGDFEGLRDAGAAVRDRTLANLDAWLERFEAEAQRRGATVLWAENGEDVARLVLEIAKRHGVKKVVKSKSMLSEEADLNAALSGAGIQPVETDLGEYILQIKDNERPSHIIAPALHLNKEEVSDLFAKVHGTPRKTVIEEMTREARDVLREHFLTADMGISGGNFLIAETGSVAIVTNEGNGRMVTTLPKVHVAVTGVEKVIPTVEDLSLLLRLLPRSATGQHISNYVSFATGTKGQADLDGPEHMYFIIVDNGRTNLVGSDMQEMLRCIRCGACMNHCPVYQTVGGHAYGWVYPGPMGSVLTPSYTGLENALDLPHAATLCGQCGVVCPVKIPLPELLRKLREKQVDRGLRPWTERAALRAWSWVARHPGLYAMATRIGVRFLTTLKNSDGLIGSFPFGDEWTGRELERRFMPAPQGRTFREMHAARQRAAKRKS